MTSHHVLTTIVYLYHICTYVHITAKAGYMAPIQGVSQQEVTSLVVPLAVGTPALSPQLHGPLSAVEYSTMGASKTHEVRGVGYGQNLHKPMLSPVVDGSQEWQDLQPSKSCNFQPSGCRTCWLQTCRPSALLTQLLHQLITPSADRSMYVSCDYFHYPLPPLTFR